MRRPFRVYIFGAGKVGRALASALKKGGTAVTLRARRRGFPRRAPQADLVILAVRDGDIAALADELATYPPGSFRAVVHCAGALGANALGALRVVGASVGQLHPLVSLAGGRGGVRGAFAHVDGDAQARDLARRAARVAGMQPFTAEPLDHTLYHASAALLANGGAALAAAAADGMARAGVDPAEAPAMLGALLESVGRNLRTLGLPAALTGPVRRGDPVAIAAHLRVLRDKAPELVPLYRALAAAQVPLARSLEEASPAAFAAIAAELHDSDSRRT